MADDTAELLGEEQPGHMVRLRWMPHDLPLKAKMMLAHRVERELTQAHRERLKIAGAGKNTDTER